MSIIKGVEVPVGLYVEQPRLRFSVDLLSGTKGVRPVIIKNPQFQDKNPEHSTCGQWLPLSVDYAIVGQLDTDIQFTIQYCTKMGYKINLKTDESLIDEFYLRHNERKDKEDWIVRTIDRYRDKNESTSYKIRMSKYVTPKEKGQTDPAYTVTLTVWDLLSYRPETMTLNLSQRLDGEDKEQADVMKGRLEKGDNVEFEQYGTIDDPRVSSDFSRMTFHIFVLKDLKSEINQHFILDKYISVDDID